MRAGWSREGGGSHTLLDATHKLTGQSSNKQFGVLLLYIEGRLTTNGCTSGRDAGAAVPYSQLRPRPRGWARVQKRVVRLWRDTRWRKGNCHENLKTARADNSHTCVCVLLQEAAELAQQQER